MKKIYCIKNLPRSILYFDFDNTHLPEILFHKDNIYNLYEIDGSVHSVWYSEGSGVSMDNSTFKEYFMYLSEIRKLKLENIK